MNNLIELLKFEAKNINNLFEQASIEGEGTPQEVSDRREAALAVFLKKYYPFPYRIAKGNIRDSYGNNSDSIDCIILNPCHPYTTTNESKYSIIFADGVDAAIELKPNLQGDEIERALKQIESVKRLKRAESVLIDLEGKLSNGFKEYSKTIPGIIFSNKTYSKIELLIDKITSYYAKNNIPICYQFDLIIVNKKYAILNIKKDGYFYLKKDIKGFYNGIVIYEYGESTLAYFLLVLNMLPQSNITLKTNILVHYLHLSPERAIIFPEYNERLLKLPYV